MLARASALLLLAGTCWAETAVPKERPRLPPTVATELKREGDRAADGSGFSSFDDFLRMRRSRPVGLGAVPDVAARAESARAEKAALASKDPSSPASQAYAAGAGVLVLPKMEVTAEKITKLKAELAAMEASQSWWTSSAEAWETRSEAGLVLDAILNPSFLRLGSYSGAGRAGAARQRVELLRLVRILRISLEAAKTPAEQARIVGDIEAIKDVIKYWE